MSARRRFGFSVGGLLVSGFSAAILVVMFASCSTEERVFNPRRSLNSDAGQQDSGVDAGADAGSAMGNACADQVDGTACGEMSGFICVNESCRETSCGDGFADSDASEQCDDGNADRADGCEPETCTYSCEEDAECDDGSPCTGEETCDTRDHLCEPGVPPDSTLRVACTLPPPPVTGVADAGTVSGTGDGGDGGPLDGSVVDSGGGVPAVDAGDPSLGVCKAGLCVPAGCGNGILQSGEECDDGNEENDDGCMTDCTYTCETDAECNDFNVCTVTETCDVQNHTCVGGSTLACEDDIDCTANNCDPQVGCVFPLIDEDGDGHAPDEFACGDDCDDSESTTYTGAGELCADDVDNNCDGQTDEIATPTWYCDNDGDTFSPGSENSVEQCDEPNPSDQCAHWTTRIPYMSDAATRDCFDSNPDVNPLQSAFSATAVPGKLQLPFDWNCDGVEEKYPVAVSQNPADTCDSIFAAGARSSVPSDEAAAAATTGETTTVTTPPADQIIICCFQLCTGDTGYTAGSQPACGNSGTYTYCDGCTRVPSGSLTQTCL